MMFRVVKAVATALSICSCWPVFALPEVAFLQPIAQEEALQKDLQLILQQAQLAPEFVTIEKAQASTQNFVSVQCIDTIVKLVIHASEKEWAATAYYGLHKLGFYFPHPRWQISPTEEQARSHCGQTYEWKPRLKYRGYHLHTLHPNEWVSGFYLGERQISEDLIRWLARNGQNAFDFSLLQYPARKYQSDLKEAFALAKSLGVIRGVSAGFSLYQQNSKTLISFVSSARGFINQKMGGALRWLKGLTFLNGLFKGDHDNTKELKRSLDKLIRFVDFDYITLEAGTSEFSSSNYERTIEWMNTAAEVLQKNQKQLFIKVHVSANQNNEKYGNFNFLPRFTDHQVGVFPHTVYFYGVEDELAPMYENKNFHHMRDFIIEEKDKRPTWFYPETSYFIVMDIDHPLLLTDYLITRSNDLDFLERNGVEGQINFTTGHELGYWLMDWTTALLTFDDYRGDPMAGLKLIGEDPVVWQQILDFQHQYFKEKQLITMLSSANFQDEIPEEGIKVLGIKVPHVGQIHKRYILRVLEEKKNIAAEERDQLAEAWAHRPSLEGVKNLELRSLLEVTWLRIQHSQHIRQALTFTEQYNPQRIEAIKAAQQLRHQALPHMEVIAQKYSRYPESSIFDKWKNPSAYDYGYGYHARYLYYWRRDEEVVRLQNYDPFFMVNKRMLFEVVSPIDF